MDPLAEPKRIAFAGDWHMNDRWAVHAIQYASEQGADVILHLGDFGYTFDARFMRPVTDALKQAGIPLLFVDGNHEDHPTLLRYAIKDNGLRELTDAIWHLPRGFRWEWNGVRFLAMGGAHSVDRAWRSPGESWWGGETITPEQVTEASQQGATDVLVAHDCPTGVMIPGIDDRTHMPPYPYEDMLRGDDHRHLLRKLVDATKPRAIWHGHYHTRYETTVDLGYDLVTVNGLDCDGAKLTETNVVVEGVV